MRAADAEWPVEAELEPLTSAQKRDLTRRVKDSDDRTRYLIVGVMLSRFVLFYDVSDDVYTLNEPLAATLFKRKRTAQAVLKLLGAGCQVIPCRVDRHGKLVRSSLAAIRAPRRRGGV